MREFAVAVDADEDAGAGDVGRVVDRRALVECLQLRLDLAEPRHRPRRDIRALRRTLPRVPAEFGAQRLAGGLLLLAEGRRLAGQAAQPRGVAVGKIDRDLDPFPALAAQVFGLGASLLGDEPVEQCGILQPAAIVVLRTGRA